MERQQRRELGIEKRQSWELPHTLIIEMDGALVDDISILFNAYISFLQKHGFEGSRSEFQELVGLPFPEFLYQLCENHGLRHSQQNLFKSYETFLSETYLPQVPLLPNAEIAVKKAHQLGLTIALVAPITRHLVRSYWAGKELSAFFEKVITPDVTDTLTSERSNLYQRALVDLGTAPEDAIAIVFSSQAKDSAKELQMTTWQISPQGKEKKILKTEPNTHSSISGWQAIIDFLQKRYN